MNYTSALFRVDSSDTIGTGHVIRCLTLALQLKNIGIESTFLMRNLVGNRFDIIRENNFKILELSPSKPKGSLLHDHEKWLTTTEDQDLKECINVISEEESFDILITDHYGISSKWQKGCGFTF
jgi:UDP-2,4-diacetamido-2,4,6-trideoxy-beta-L-altropyranose hydrolase